MSVRSYSCPANTEMLVICPRVERKAEVQSWRVSQFTLHNVTLVILIVINIVTNIYVELPK